MSTALAQDTPVIASSEVNSCIGQITISVTSGTTPYTYRWENGAGDDIGQTGRQISNLAPDNYTVIVTDAIGKTTTETYPITDPPDLLGDITIKDVLCKNDRSGSVNIEMTNGNPDYEWVLYNSSNQRVRSGDEGGLEIEILGLNADNYTLSILDSDGCTGELNFTINEPAEDLHIELLSQIDPLCFEQNSGRISVEPTGGTIGSGDYSYSWVNTTFPGTVIGTDSEIDNLSSGEYRVRVTDDNGCSTFLEITLVDPEELIFVDSLISDATCNGNADGSIEVTVTGGTGILSYVWSNGGTTANISGLSAGDYTITITDENGCSIQGTYTVNEPNALAVSETITNVGCRGENSGAITLAVSGGNGGYSYRWSDGNTSQNRTNILAGNYSVEITDSRGCTINETYTISEPIDGLNLDSVIDTNPTCIGDADGSLSVNVSGGVAPYLYSWDNGGNAQTINNLSSGNYRLTVTDANGCTLTVNATLEDPEAISPNINIVRPTCSTEVDGSITLNPTNGVGPYTYLWADGQTTNRIENLAAGSYSVQITDSKGCQSNQTITVTEPDVIQDNAVLINVSCFGQGDGSIQLNPTGGSESFTYLWNDGTTNDNIVGLEPGNYTVEITDTNGCTFSNTYTITEPNTLELHTSKNDVLCFGETTGNIDITIAGGTAPYSYSWTNGETTEDLNGIPAGNYSIEVTDANGCTISENVIIQEPDSPISSVITVKEILCPGDSNGSIELSISGGEGPYNYLWNTGSTDDTIDNLSSGTYSVTITDTNGCQRVQSVVLDEPEIIRDNANVNNISCNAANDGSIVLTATGGTGTFDYLWSTGSTSNSITNLSPGNYSVEITDSNGCVLTNSYLITEPEVLELTSSNTNVLCFGESTASIDIEITGGTKPYNYSWSNGATTEDLSNIQSGNYTVQVTDANGCTVSEAILVSQPAEPITVNETIVNVVCSGEESGSITIEASGGSGGYSYLWSTGSTNKDIDNLASGNYELTITDSNGCTFSSTYTVTTPNELILTGTVVNNLCADANQGSIDLIINGGTGPYAISWGNGNTSEDLFNLLSDTYNVTVTDANGCSATASFEIIEPSQIQVTSNIKGVTCFGQDDGSIELSITGGTGLYAFQWSNGSTSKDISSLSGGDYTVLVTDQNGCQITENITVPAPIAPLNAISTTQGIACNGENTGAINLEVTGGTAPYLYVWSNNSRLKDLRNVPPGDYDITITDANSCTFSTSFTLGETEPILASFSANEPTCLGDSNGSIEVDVSGGTGPYTYEWSNNSTSKDQFNLTSDQYTVIIRDANNCTLTQSIDLGGNRGLDISVNTTDASCKGDSNGAVSIDVSGGSGNFSFQWDNGNTTNSLENLLAGVYRCVITDGEGCDNSVTVVISEPSQNLEASLEYSARLSCFNGQDGFAIANPVGGTAPYNYLWSNFESVQRIDGLSSGSYSVIITDANSCTYQQSFEITEPDELLEIQVEGKLELNCIGDNDGSIKIEPIGGEGPYEILWSNGNSSNQLDNLRAGNYSVQVRDNAGCILQRTISITQSEGLQITNFEIKDTECYDDRTGSINIDVEGGTKPYAFQWSNGSNQKNLTGVSTGSYNVIITDANNCTYQQTFNLDNAPRFELDPQISPISCIGAEDASISLNIQGGTGPYSIVWNTGGTDEIITDLRPGVYEARVVDNNGCDISQTFNITDPSPIASAAIINDAIDCDDPNSGSIFLTTSGGTPPYSYEWTNGVTTSSILNISEGDYGVIITDQFGCSLTKTFSVTRPEELSITLQSELIIDCESQNVIALVQAEVTGGLSDYEFVWNKSPSTESIAEISQPGRVVLNVTDRRGCTTTAEINLDFPKFSNAEFTFNSASLERDQLLSVFDSIYFQDLSGDATVKWQWDFGDEFTSDLQNPSHLYPAPGDYQVSLFSTDEAGCQTSTSMILKLERGYRVIIPTAFTPDGDGLNDFFQAKFIGLESYRLSIFSKSGEIIFSTSEIDSRGWDGLIGGQKAMNGQYVYRFTGLSYTGVDIEQTGTFSLVN